MILYVRQGSGRPSSIPRESGDDPNVPNERALEKLYSPRERG